MSESKGVKGHQRHLGSYTCAEDAARCEPGGGGCQVCATGVRARARLHPHAPGGDDSHPSLLAPSRATQCNTPCRCYDRAAIRLRGAGAELNFPYSSYKDDAFLRAHGGLDKCKFLDLLRSRFALGSERNRGAAERAASQPTPLAKAQSLSGEQTLSSTEQALSASPSGPLPGDLDLTSAAMHQLVSNFLSDAGAWDSSQRWRGAAGSQPGSGSYDIWAAQARSHDFLAPLFPPQSRTPPQDVLKEYEEEFARVYGSELGLAEEQHRPYGQQAWPAAAPWAEQGAPRYEPSYEGHTHGSGFTYLSHNQHAAGTVLLGRPLPSARAAPGGGGFHPVHFQDDVAALFDAFPHWDDKVALYGPAAPAIY